MNTFEAVNHGLTTMPSGGFSTTDDSIGHWDSAALESIILVFMFLAGVNFTLLYFIVQRQPGKMWADEEFKTHIAYLVGATAIITAALYVKGGDVGSEPLRKSLFQVVAIDLDGIRHGRLHAVARHFTNRHSDVDGGGRFCRFDRRWSQTAAHQPRREGWHDAN